MNITQAITNFVNIQYVGIKTRFPSPPQTVGQISTAQLPLLFVRYAQIGRSENTLSFTGGGIRNAEFEIVVLVDAARQSLQTKNYEAMRVLMTELSDKWELNSSTLQILSYTIREGDETVGDTNYYAIIANVEVGL